ncbi:MAG TPA: putative metal-binding motif-containing protein [Alphaproteobacteria bacterium]|nr:putative metal-binding motif-containing protein [Alphaproteobacteria bacterium]
MKKWFLITVIFLISLVLFLNNVYAACTGTSSCGAINSGNGGQTRCDGQWGSSCTWSGGSCINDGSALPTCSSRTDQSSCTAVPGCTWDGGSGGGGSGCTTCSSGACCINGCVASSSSVCSTSSPTWRCSAGIIYGDTQETHCNGVNTLCNGAVTSASFVRNNCNNFERYYCTDGPSSDVCTDGVSRCADGSDNDGDGVRDCQDSECSGAFTRACSVGIGACARSGYQVRQCSGSTWLSTYGACSATAGSPTTEICNGIDDDCDSFIDEQGGPLYSLDSDGDRYYTSDPYYSCSNPGGGWTTATMNGGGDCNDGNSAVRPGAAEVCNNIDDDCDGSIDESLTQVGSCSQLGRCAGATQTCNAGVWSACSITPITEACNGIDDNCNGMGDEPAASNFYYDYDRDGWGNATNYVQACSAPSSQYVTNNLDCNDRSSNSLYWGYMYYRDRDGDGHGNNSDSVQACTASASYPTHDNFDCDDSNPSYHYISYCYYDGDNDGYAINSNYISGCFPYTPNNYRPPSNPDYICNYNRSYDCDDANPAVSSYLCYVDTDSDRTRNSSNVYDTTCDGTPNKVIDRLYFPPFVNRPQQICSPTNNFNDCAVTNQNLWRNLTLYYDGDSDGYTTGSPQVMCLGASIPTGWTNASLGTDCNDADAALTTPDSCTCAPYIPYNDRIGFSNLQSPTFRVPNEPTVIDRVCDLYLGVYRSATTTVVANGGSEPLSVRSNPRVIISSISLPICNDFGSLTQYCRELGYDLYDTSSIISGASGTCARGPSWSSSTGTTITSVACKYDSMGSTFNVAFNLNIQGTGIQSYKYGCNGNDQGQTGPDGVCVDDFSATPICGFNATGFPVDPDCGNHTNMTHGVVRKSDNSVVSITPSVPIPKPHKACANSSDCVTNIRGSLECVPSGTIMSTGSSDDFTQVINITCSASNTWCFKGYTYQAGSCQFVSQEDCFIATCPDLNTFAFMPDGTVFKDGMIYKIDNVGGSCYFYTVETHTWSTCSTTDQVISDTRADVGTGLRNLLKNNNCRIQQGTKIKGVCVATQTYPELKYSVQDVIVK